MVMTALFHPTAQILLMVTDLQATLTKRTGCQCFCHSRVPLTLISPNDPPNFVGSVQYIKYI